MSKFFIDRPVFAWVIALFVLVLGSVAVAKLPVAQYPSVAPPSIVVSAFYPGASAQTLEDSVLSIIEQEMNGSPGLIYMESVAQANGSGSINLSFESGTNPDLAQVDVQNRLSRAGPRLPAAVTQQGVRVDKARSNFLLFTILSSENAEFDPVALGDYASRTVLPEIQRIPGVGQAQLFGTERAMRIWIDPAKLVNFNLSMADVNGAIRSQNAQVSAGAIGDLPNIAGQGIAATVVVNGQLTSVEEFSNIVLRANTDGSTVRLRDVARLELGAQGYAISARLNGKPSTGIGVQLAPTGNALATAKAIRARMEELSKFFPKGMTWSIPFDSSRFVSISISQVVETLAEAMILVFLVMYLFLQNLRYTAIPAIVVPVSLLGTFAVLLALGFSINVLTMFGMVLVIGIVVDDAIVVVENVERIMSEEGLPPREATVKAMGQIQGAIVGVTVVLISVFVPLAFFGGAVGNIYKQFSAVMLASISISAFMALSLTPALCATLLKPMEAGHHLEKRGFFGRFNRGFARTAKGYEGFVARILRRTGRALVVYAAIIAAVAVLFLAPAHLVPAERGPGLHAGERAAAAGRDHRAHEKRDDPGRGLHPQAARSPEHGGGAGLFVLGPGAERGPGFRDAEGLERPQGRRAHGAGHRRPRFRRAVAHPRCLHLRPQPARDSRAGHGHGLQLPPAGSRRQRPRGAGGGAQPAAGPGRPEQDRGGRAARRAGGCAATAGGHRPRQGQRPGRELRRDQLRAVHGARVELCQRLPESRPPAARGGAGRRARAHAAGRPAAAFGAEQQGGGGAAVGLRDHALDQRRDADHPLQRLSGDAHFRRRRPGPQHR